MTLLDQLQDLGHELADDARDFVPRAVALIEEQVQQHPQVVFALLRVAKPILRVKGVAIVTRYRDVVDVLRDDDSFSVSGYAPPMRSIAGDFILGLDQGPEYERHVSLLRLAFRQTDVPDIAALVAETATELVDGRAGSGRLDVVRDLADRVPARLVARWFGVPGPDEDTLIRWSRALFEEIFTNLKHDPAITARANAAAAEINPYLDQLVADRKAQLAAGHPGPDDLLGRLLAQQVLGDAFSDQEIRANLIGLLVGCIPTTSKAASLALDELLRRPAELEKAQQAAGVGDDVTVACQVREAMRFAPQAPGLFRHVRREVTIGAGTWHATQLSPGDVVFAATQSAMLDGEIVRDPDAFRPDRPDTDYLHYGAGLHACLGRYVNDLQVSAIVGSVLRLSGLRRAQAEGGELVMAGNFPNSLTVEFDPR
jgi:cytochrome P450